MPIRQKVRPLLLLRKQLGHFQRVGTNTLAIANRLQGIGTGPGQTGLRALSLAASVGSDDVTVNFNEGVVVTDPTSGVSITVNGQAATFTAVKGTRSMVYTLTSQNPIAYDDVIVWTYDSLAAGADPYTGETSGEELADSTLSRVMPSEPPRPAVTSIVAINQRNIVVTFDAQVTGSASAGVDWTGLNSAPLAGDPVNIIQITYVLQPPDDGNIYNSSNITWQYTEAAGTLVDASTGRPVADTGPLTVDVSNLPDAPVPEVDIYLPLLADLNPSTGAATPSFTRNSIATVVTSNGLVTQVEANEPRFQGSTRNAENDWSAHANSVGLLIEESRTNEITHSEDMNDAAWDKVRVVVTGNADTSPDGNTTAERITDDASVSPTNVYLRYFPPVPVAGDYKMAYSVFAKADNNDWLAIRQANWSSPTSASAWFNLATGTVGTVEGALDSAEIQDYGNGWYRCIIYWTLDATSTLGDIRNYICNTDASNVIVVDGSNSLLLWGAQLEQVPAANLNHYASSYIPTGATTVTRADDILNYSMAPGKTAGSMAMTHIPREVKGSGNYLLGSSAPCRYAVMTAGSVMRSRDAATDVNYSSLAKNALTRIGLTWEVGGSPERATYQNGAQVLTGAVVAEGFDYAANPIGVGNRGENGTQIGPGNYSELKFWDDVKDQTFMENETAIPGQPATPVIDTISAGNGSLTINYSHPGPFNYAEFFNDGVTMNHFDNDNDRTHTITGLTNGVTYNISMKVYSDDFVASEFSNTVPGTPQAGGYLYEDNFDSGNWAGEQNGVQHFYANPGTTEITSDNPNSGAHSVKFTFERWISGASNGTRLEYYLGIDYNELWVEYDVYFAPNYRSASTGSTNKDGHNKFHLLFAGPGDDGSGPNGDPLLDNGYSYANSDVLYSHEIWDTAGYQPFEVSWHFAGAASGPQCSSVCAGICANTSDCTFNQLLTIPEVADLGRWMRLKFHTKASSGPSMADGVFEVWKDGTKIMDVRDVDDYNTTRHAFRWLRIFGNHGMAFSEDTYAWLDNLKISNTPI